MFLPLWGRAVETKKEKPLLVDKKAVEIIEKIDYDFSGIAQNTHGLTQLAWIMRSLCVDEVIHAFLSENPMGTIVNIGCGLDTTFERVDNGLVVWDDLDLPDVIDLRRKFTQESDRRRFVACSFLNEKWLDEVCGEEKVLFIAAGVFYYFEKGQIKRFLIRLADKVPGCEILFDVSSKKMMQRVSKLGVRSLMRQMPNPFH